MYIKPLAPDHPEVLELIHALDAYQAMLYPAESNHLDGVNILNQSNVIMVGALDSNQKILGIGAVKFMDGYGEIKRMFVPQTHRKKGVAQKILQALEHFTMERQIPLLRLETGILQEAAIGLYQAAGFKIIGPFGEYSDDPLSVFMEKILSRF